MFWSKRYDDKKDYMRVQSFDIRLYEDGVLAESAQDCNGSYRFALVPSEGKSYRLEADVEDYGTAMAETSIPKAASGRAEFVKWKENYIHFSVNDIVIPESKRAIWIKPSFHNGNYEPEYVEDMFTLNPFPDQINTYLESEDITDTESNIGYEYFIRIPRMNATAAFPLNFSFQCYPGIFPGAPSGPGWDDDEEEEVPVNPGEESNEEIHINIITPSDEYDKYYRLLYKQEMFNYEADFPIFSESVSVFSNVGERFGYIRRILYQPFGL